jgi:hypothetical protein
VEELKIGNLDCAGFVLARGVQLMRCVLKRNGYTDFVFANDAGKAGRARSEYYRNGLISGLKLHEAMRTLKRAAGPPPGKRGSDVLVPKSRRVDGDKFDWATVFKDDTESA